MRDVPTPHLRSAAGLREAAWRCLVECDRDRKVLMTRETCAQWRAGNLVCESDDELPSCANVTINLRPGLPEGLRLISPTKVSRRGFGSVHGFIAFVHAIAHIEWNAINLAWDAVWRFGAMPLAFYGDWASVAGEEAQHFSMLRGRLRDLGSDYGELPAHDGLWETAQATRHDLLDRMALVPRVLEARGLDVTPGLITKLRNCGDEATAAILDVVLREEVGHVRIGSRWFHFLCEQRGLAPAAAFGTAVRAHFRGRTRPVHDPVARRLRIEAGFREDELDVLESISRGVSSQ